MFVLLNATPSTTACQSPLASPRTHTQADHTPESCKFPVCIITGGIVVYCLLSLSGKFYGRRHSGTFWLRSVKCSLALPTCQMVCLFDAAHFVFGHLRISFPSLHHCCSLSHAMVTSFSWPKLGSTRQFLVVRRVVIRNSKCFQTHCKLVFVFIQAKLNASRRTDCVPCSAPLSVQTTAV